ncbi:hypothetical protein [Salinarchaeum laminariae]|uniref:hypothetical protein n=1 Tax=Salinarchaeum laminariae TaxID=869888 RepID=UPI0020BD5855|nr:hypothetical protein [Salinarchaeum laminariae]
MERGRSVRSVGIALALVLVVSLAGCGALGGGGGGSSCGPGETKISSVAGADMTDRQQVSFTGEVVALASPDMEGAQQGNSYAIDDGSGSAFVPGLSDGVEEGDCVTVSGSAYPNPADAGADVIMSATNVTQN